MRDLLDGIIATDWREPHQRSATSPAQRVRRRGVERLPTAPGPRRRGAAL